MIWSKPEPVKEEKSFFGKLWSKPEPIEEKKTFLGALWSTPKVVQEEKTLISKFWKQPEPEPVQETFWSKIGWKEEKPEKDTVEEMDLVTKTLHIAKTAQTRFSWIKPNQVNPAVVNAGIRDNSLGSYGRAIIRFCYPAVGADTKSTYTRIVIDPTGYPNPKHLHIPVPSALVTSSGYIQKTCEFVGDSLLVLSIVFTGARLFSASQNEKGIVPEAALISAEYVGGFLGGGTGAKVGAAVGSVGGPVGSVLGAVSGSIMGSYYALQFVKSQEKFVEENTKRLTNKIK